MSSLEYISELLNIKDKNIEFTEVINKRFKNVECKVVCATLAYKPERCYHCNHEFDNGITVHGYKKSVIKIPDISKIPSFIELKKQRYFCSHCNRTFTLKTPIVEYGCNISNNTKTAILLEIRKKLSEKEISKRFNVRHNTVSRLIFSEHHKNRTCYTYLPDTLCFDEFKSTRDAKGAMSFIYYDYNNSKILDIVENRQLGFLKKYFSNFSKSARDNVKFVVMDIYSPYISLVNDMFKNAEIIFDRFHIYNLISSSLNKTRIKLMNPHKGTPVYTKLKRHYKLLLKESSKLDCVNYKKYVSYSHFQCELDIVEDLLLIDEELRETYELYQSLLSAFNNKDVAAIENLIKQNYKSKKVSEYMQISLKTLNKYNHYILNAFKYEPSNGKLEATNNLIKVIKRIAMAIVAFLILEIEFLLYTNITVVKKLLPNKKIISSKISRLFI